jgi:CheY-like chemotaxis protein
MMTTETRAETPHVASRRLLVVDDNEDAAEILAEGMRMHGYDVRLASSGEQAMELVPAFAPEIILLDIGLPAMDGFEVARRVRQDRVASGALIIALSGYGASSDREQSKCAGIDHHLVKPVTLAQVRQIIAAGR